MALGYKIKIDNGEYFNMNSELGNIILSMLLSMNILMIFCLCWEIHAEICK